MDTSGTSSTLDIEVDELQKNLLSDLDLDSRGWLRSQSLGNHGDDGSKSPIPVVFPACEKLQRQLKLHDEADKADDNVSNPKNVKGDNGVNVDVDVDADVTDLPYVANVQDMIVSALNQITKMTSPRPATAPSKKKHKKSNKNAQDSNNNRSDSNGSSDQHENDPNSEWEQVGEEATKAFSQEFEEYYSEASERTPMTFNTIALLLSILMPMIDHPSQSDFDIVMKHGPSIKSIKKAGKKPAKNKEPKVEGNVMELAENRKYGKKTQSYLFFENVYSISTERQLRSLKKEVKQIYNLVNNLFSKVYRQNPVPGKSFFNHEDQSAIPKLFKECTMSPADVIQRTLLTSLDPQTEEFGHRVDKAIITPLEEDRRDMHRLHEFSVQILRNRLTQILTGAFRNSHLELYGSCLSGLSLGNSSDVDISLFIPAANDLFTRYQDGQIDRNSYQRQMKKFVYKTFDSLNGRGRHRKGPGGEFRELEAVPYARVPVVKGKYLNANNPFSQDGSMHFDICILNDIAVANSGLLREYSLLDQRVKMLMLSVKSWVKWNNIGSAADNTLSSYTWMIMCIYYLQCIEFLPTLQCPKLMEAHGQEYDPMNRMHNVNGLRTVYLSSALLLKQGIWKQPDRFRTTPVSGLLTGFFLFYARHFPQETTAVSIRLGNLSLQKTVFRSSRLWRLAVEDPFETHDSHCPHDLGTPMTEFGQTKVMAALAKAGEKMEKMCINCDEMIENFIGSCHLLQEPQVEKVETKSEHITDPTRKGHQQQRKGSGGGRSNNRNPRNRASKKVHRVGIKQEQTPQKESRKPKHGQEGQNNNNSKNTESGRGTPNRKNEQSKRKKKPHGSKYAPGKQGNGGGDNAAKELWKKDQI